MSKRAIRYAVIDAFTKEAFKGNPAAVCFLEENSDVDEHWMQSVVQEFNAPAAAFVSPVISAIGTNGQEESSGIGSTFAGSPIAVPICGHATLATAHFLFSSDLAEQDTIEFVSKWGLLLARKIIGPTFKEETFTVELDFPVDPVVRCDVNELPCIPLTLNGVPIINVMKTTACGDLIASQRSGVLHLELDEESQRVRISGEAVTIMVGTILV
ncbi:Phenazine biosynthesis-like domain-containing protein [Rhynchospora pubera]|uniref:Phenazine biosynthesis-like domain-containing protein n=1 Tax=Rhynchospora pubera TaxID=906938 RepID=A0AAV8GXG0_9POAL|nr:Phenazine biosynthesis-like domain-containing protein [Rhynchospora pubera]